MVNVAAKDELGRTSDYGVLIIGYKRIDSLQKILDLCKKNSVKRIYLAVDAAKDAETSMRQTEIKSLVATFASEFSGVIKVLYRIKNVGCAASVLSAVDWLFETEKFGVIIEDDCIPSNDFFKYCEFSFPVIENDNKVWLACGMQLAPPDLDSYDSDWLLSKYALTWGWATTSTKWIEVKSKLISAKKIRHKPFDVEATYWSAGAQRANRGFTDIWDTVFVRTMLLNDKYAILPRFPLITNVGNDAYATHTSGDASWLNIRTGDFAIPTNKPIKSPQLDEWLLRNVYKIRLRHLISTRVTALKDLFGFHKNLGFLKERWERANFERNAISQ